MNTYIGDLFFLHCRKSPQARRQVKNCPVAVECSCISTTGSTSGSSSSDRLFADMFYKHFVLTNKSDLDNRPDDVDNNYDDVDNSSDDSKLQSVNCN